MKKKRASTAVWALVATGCFFLFGLVLYGMDSAMPKKPTSGPITKARVQQFKPYEGHRMEDLGNARIGDNPALSSAWVNGRHLAYTTYHTEDGKIEFVMDVETGVILRVMDGN